MSIGSIPSLRAVAWAVAVAVFVGSFLFRLLEPVFANDHFEYLAMADQILGGEKPGIDFLDSGRPLQYYLSAAGLWLFGHQVLAEAILCVTLLSMSAALVFILGLELSGAVSLGALAAIFVVAILPRLYGYPKIVVPALALLACWRYLDRPSPSRLVGVGLVTAVSFYLRYDYGVWVGCAATVALLGGHWREWRVLTRAVLVYAGVVALLCGPYLVLQLTLGGRLTSGPGTGRLSRLLAGEDLVSLGLPTVPPDRPLLSLRPAGPLSTVEWESDVSDDARVRLEQRYSLHAVQAVRDHAWQYVLVDRSPATLRRLIADPAVNDLTNIDDQGRIVRDPLWSVLRRWLHVPVMESPFLNKGNAAIWLYDVLFLTPLAAAGLLAVRVAKRRSQEGEASKVLVAVTLGVLFNFFLIRGNLDSHLPDVIVPAALLWAWMLRGRARELSHDVRAAIGRNQGSGRALGGSLARFSVASGLVLSAWMAVDAHAGAVNHLAATDLFSGPVRAARRLEEAIRDLRQEPLERFAPPGSRGLPALTRYLNRCTRETDRLLVVGYQPEVYFHANRRFGGGIAVFTANMGAAPVEQALIVERLQRQHVPIVIVPVDRLGELRAYPIVSRYLDTRYEIAREFGFGDARPFRVLIDREAVPSHIDEEWGLPCFSR